MVSVSPAHADFTPAMRLAPDSIVGKGLNLGAVDSGSILGRVFAWNSALRRSATIGWPGPV